MLIHVCDVCNVALISVALILHMCLDLFGLFSKIDFQDIEQ